MDEFIRVGLAIIIAAGCVAFGAASLILLVGLLKGES